MGLRPLSRTRALAAAPGPLKPQSRTFAKIIVQSPRLCATWRLELAQTAATSPRAGSASPCRDRTLARGRSVPNAARIQTILCNWRQSAAARLCHRTTSKPSRPASAPEPTWRGTPERNNTAARRSAVQCGKGYTDYNACAPQSTRTMNDGRWLEGTHVRQSHDCRRYPKTF